MSAQGLAFVSQARHFAKQKVSYARKIFVPLP